MYISAGQRLCLIQNISLAKNWSAVVMPDLFYETIPVKIRLVASHLYGRLLSSPESDLYQPSLVKGVAPLSFPQVEHCLLKIRYIIAEIVQIYIFIKYNYFLCNKKPTINSYALFNFYNISVSELSLNIIDFLNLEKAKTNLVEVIVSQQSAFSNYFKNSITKHKACERMLLLNKRSP